MNYNYDTEVRISLGHQLVSYEPFTEATVQLKQRILPGHILQLAQDVFLVPSRSILGIGHGNIRFLGV